MEERFTMMPHSKEVILCAEKIGNHAAGSYYTVSGACVGHW
jgi:hypothetical protein